MRIDSPRYRNGQSSLLRAAIDLDLAAHLKKQQKEPLRHVYSSAYRRSAWGIR